MHRITLKTEHVTVITGREKVLLAFKKNKKIKYMSMFLIGKHTGVISGGYLTNIVKELCLDGLLTKSDCPTCNTASVYQLVK